MERFRKGAPLTTIQPPYNLFEREIEKDVLPYAGQNGLVVLAYSALCRGLLTGKITAKTEFKGDDLRKVDPKFQQPRLGHYLAAVARLDAFARSRRHRHAGDRPNSRRDDQGRGWPRIHGATAVFRIRIRHQLDREIAFSAMWPKCSHQEFFNTIGDKADLREGPHRRGHHAPMSRSSNRTPLNDHDSL
jgi:Aldo/keto reductase family